MIKDLLNVPKEFFPGFYPLCSLAYHCCLRQQLMLEYQNLGEVNKYINSRESIYNLLFGKEVDSPSAISCMLYQCDHKTVMEALAAVHIAVLTPAEQQQIWEEWFTAPHMAQVWMMYCGLTGLKSVDLRRLCSLTVSERSREVMKDLRANALHDDYKLVMVSLFEASNDEEAKRVLPVLLKNTIRGYVGRSQHDVLCLAYSIRLHPHLSRVRLWLSDGCSELDLQPLTTSLMNVKAIGLSCGRMEPMLTVLPRAVEDLSLDFTWGAASYKGLGDALRDCHCLRSLTIDIDHSALCTELDSVLNSNRLTELHLKSDFEYGGVNPPSMETLKNLLVHREKCSLKMELTDHQLSALLSGLKRADRLKELDCRTKLSHPEVNPDQWLVTCAEVEELVATHPYLVKVDVENSSYNSDLLKVAVAKGAIKNNKNITHLGLGEYETRAVHPLLRSPSADHITSIRAEYHYWVYGYNGGDDAWSKNVIAGPMARQTCHLDLRGLTPASLGLLLSRVNTATKLKDLSLEVVSDSMGDLDPVDVRAVETAFTCCNLCKLRIEHYQPPVQWYCLYSAILNGLAANTTAQVDSCIYGYDFDVEEITRHLSQQTLQRFEVVRKEDMTYLISRDPSCPSVPVPSLPSSPAPGTSPSQQDTPTKHGATPPNHEATPTNHVATPIMHEATPTNHVDTSTNRVDTPTKHETTPTKHEATPTKHVATPTKCEATPPHGTPLLEPPHGGTLPGPEDAQRILDQYKGRLLSEDMDAEAVATRLKHSHVIPPKLATRLSKQDTTEEGNELLFEHLRRQATSVSLQTFSRVLVEVGKEGYPRMKVLGEELLAELDRLPPAPS